MSTTRSFFVRTLIAFAVVASSVIASAQTLVQGTLSNFDFWNYTGQTANDFEVTLWGITPNQIAGLYTGYYPNTTVTTNGTSTTIRWTGSSTPSGSFAHFGVTLFGVDMSKYPTRVNFTWTKDGVVIATLPRAWQAWVINPNTGEITVRTDIIRNPGPTRIFVQRRVAISVQRAMDLKELMRDGDLWNQGIVIDPSPVAIEPGGQLTYDFKMPNATAWAVMMYDVFDTSGRRISTFLNATNDAPSVSSRVGSSTKIAKSSTKKSTAKKPALKRQRKA